MIVYFSSVTEFTHRFVEKLELPKVRIPLNSNEASLLSVESKFILITPTYGSNQKDFVPKQVIKFLNNPVNRLHLEAVISSGNRNFLDDYAKAGSVISEKCKVPWLYTFELAGTEEDVERVNRGLDKWATKLAKSHT